MFSIDQTTHGTDTDLGGYWPARAAQLLEEGKYSKAVELCRLNLSHESRLLSARLIYGRALFHAGQLESASEQFYHALSIDPNNVVALKYLGDICFRIGDELAAMANYERILEIDPYCSGLASQLKQERSRTTGRLTMVRKPQTEPAPSEPARKILFYTETMGDLYLKQGHSRLAAEVFRTMRQTSDNPRLAEKLAEAERRIAERRITEKETRDVS
jgi:tetratricopeptide (TPR) repeat protein